jgi:RNA polymerase sigma-70 factor (ECF subfamily)
MIACPVSNPDTRNAEEAALIRKILGGRRELFADLIAQHVTPLLRTIRATTDGHPDAEDIIQQTVLKAFTHLEQFQFRASFRTWLIQIGLNEARQWRRKAGFARFVALDGSALARLSVANERHSPFMECQRSEVIVRLRNALARLPEAYRTIILLRDLEELSLSEVAQRLRLTLPAVKTRHWRARRRIAKLLGQSSLSRPRSHAC